MVEAGDGLVPLCGGEISFEDLAIVASHLEVRLHQIQHDHELGEDEHFLILLLELLEQFHE